MNELAAIKIIKKKVNILQNQLDNLKDYITSLEIEDGKRISYDQKKSLHPEPKKKKSKLILKVKHPSDIVKIIDIWNQTQRKHSKPLSKIYKKIVKNIRALKAGTFFNRLNSYEEYKGRKFTEDEIIGSIKKFDLASNNEDYEPSGNYKDWMRKLGMNDFFHNPRSENNKSLFINYLENKPKLVAEKYRTDIKDKNPKLTKAIKRVYIKEILGNIHPTFTAKEESNFKVSSNRLLGFYKENRKKLNSAFFNNSNQENELANLLFNSVVFDVGPNNKYKISSGFLSSDLTFSKRLLTYLNQQGIILY